MDLLRWTIVFLILALCAAVLGFGGFRQISPTSARSCSSSSSSY